MSPSYRRIRWLVLVAVTLFVLLMVIKVLGAGSLGSQLFWVLLLYGGILLFTVAVFHRLERLQERVEEQSAAYRSLFEASGLGIVAVGEDCVITKVNQAAEELSGWRQSELVGRSACAELISQPGGPSLGCPGLCSHCGQREPASASSPALFLLQQKQGGQVPVVVNASSLEVSGKRIGQVFLLRDGTEFARLESEAATRRRRTEGLRQIGLEITALPDLEAGMERVLDQARELFEMDLIAWGILDLSPSRIAWRVARGAGSQLVQGAELPVAETVMGRLLGTGRPFVTHRLGREPDLVPEGRVLFSNPLLQTAMAVPLRVRDNSYGVLLCASTQVLSLTDEDVMLFTHLGSYLATAVENTQLMDQVQHMAALEERQRLARELHDSLGQMLTYVGMRNHMITRLAEQGDTTGIIAETANLKEVLREAHTDLRQSIFKLKESSRPWAPLADRWQELALRFEEQSGIAVVYQVEGRMPVRLPAPQELQLTRIIQEVLANVRNHSGARSVLVRLQAKPNRLQITISDDGCGFDREAVHGPDQHHFGLSIMQERAVAAGAELDVRSSLGHGTVVTIGLDL